MSGIFKEPQFKHKIQKTNVLKHQIKRKTEKNITLKNEIAESMSWDTESNKKLRYVGQCPKEITFFSKRCSLTDWGKIFLKCTELLFHFQLCAKIILFYGPFVIHVVRCAGQLWWQTWQLQSSTLVLAKSTEPSKARPVWVDLLWCRVEYERLHAE